MVYLLYALIIGIPFVFFAAEISKERKNKELQIQAR